MSAPARGADLMSEDDLLVAVIDLAHVYGWKVAHFRPAQTNKGMRTAVSADGRGFPDLVLAHPTRGLLFVELKTARGTVPPEQHAWLNLLGRHAPARVWRPADLDEARRVLSAPAALYRREAP